MTKNERLDQLYSWCGITAAEQKLYNEDRVAQLIQWIEQEVPGFEDIPNRIMSGKEEHDKYVGVVKLAKEFIKESSEPAFDAKSGVTSIALISDMNVYAKNAIKNFECHKDCHDLDLVNGTSTHKIATCSICSHVFVRADHNYQWGRVV